MAAEQTNLSGPNSPARLGRPSIVIALVSPVGVDLAKVAEAINFALDLVRYTGVEIRVSKLIQPYVAEDDRGGTNFPNRFRELMNIGDRLRQSTDENAICAMLAIMSIAYERDRRTSDKHDGLALIVRSLKHPDEVKLIREVYGLRAVVVGVSDSKDNRLRWLEQAITPAGATDRETEGFAAGEAAELLRRDEHDERRLHGQHVRDAFELCDVYLPPPGTDLRSGAERLVRLLFGDPAITPNKDEMGVWHAFAAKFRSSAAGRQVGAVITDHEGEVLVSGCNDVPSPGGGQYWDGDVGVDYRDRALGYDANDRHKFLLLADIMHALKRNKWLDPQLAPQAAEDLARQALARDGGPLRGRRVDSLIEFGRIMHAEMAALMTAARRGTPVRGSTLYTTTYPCHECMRLIIGSGVLRVVYIDPYAKSLVPQLFADQLDKKSVGEHPTMDVDRFVGVAPRLMARVFGQVDRRTRRHDGTFTPWRGSDARFVGEDGRFVDSVVMREAAVGLMISRDFPDLLDRGDGAESDGSLPSH